jgi:hypothetical protein
MQKRDTQLCNTFRPVQRWQGMPVVLRKSEQGRFSIVSGKAMANIQLERYGQVTCSCEGTESGYLIYQVASGERLVMSFDQANELSADARAYSRQVLKKIMAL